MNGTNKELEGTNPIQICQMTIELVEVVSRVHMQAFKGGMNTRLGKSYIRKFLDWFVRVEAGIALVAIAKTGENEQIVGYVIGAPIDYGKALNRDLFWVAGWNIMIRPWLILSEQFRENIKSRLTVLFNPSHDQISKIDLPMPVMSLVGLAVMPNFQGQNIGRKLLCAFEKQARALHVRSLRLSVYPENLAARRVYEKCCWVPYESSVSSGRAMFYCRIL